MRKGKIAAFLEIEIDCCRLQSLQSGGLMALIVMSLMNDTGLTFLFVAALSISVDWLHTCIFSISAWIDVYIRAYSHTKAPLRSVPSTSLWPLSYRAMMSYAEHVSGIFYVAEGKEKDWCGNLKCRLIRGRNFVGNQARSVQDQDRVFSKIRYLKNNRRYKPSHQNPM